MMTVHGGTIERASATADTRDILVVEDDPDTRIAVVTFLNMAGYEAYGVEDGLEALAYLRAARPPALILLDLMMPTMDGWRFRTVQLADPRLAAVPVAILSGRGGVAECARELGIRDYVEKPIDPDHLLSLVAHRCPPPDAVDPR